MAQKQIVVGTREEREANGETPEPYARRMVSATYYFTPRFDETDDMRGGLDESGEGMFVFHSSQQTAGELIPDHSDDETDYPTPTEATVRLKDPIRLPDGGDIAFTPAATQALIHRSPNLTDTEGLRSIGADDKAGMLEAYFMDDGPETYDQWTERIAREGWTFQEIAALYYRPKSNNPSVSAAAEMRTAVREVTGHDGIVSPEPEGREGTRADVWTTAAIRDVDHANPRYHDGEYPDTEQEWFRQVSYAANMTPFDWEACWRLPPNLLFRALEPDGSVPMLDDADTGNAHLPGPTAVAADVTMGDLTEAMRETLEGMGYTVETVADEDGAISQGEYGGFLIEPGRVVLSEANGRFYPNGFNGFPLMQDMAHALGTARAMEYIGGGSGKRNTYEAWKDYGRRVGDAILESYDILEPKKRLQPTRAAIDASRIVSREIDPRLHDRAEEWGHAGASMLLEAPDHDAWVKRDGFMDPWDPWASMLADQKRAGQAEKASPSPDVRPVPDDPWAAIAQDNGTGLPSPDPGEAAPAGPDMGTGPDLH